MISILEKNKKGGEERINNLCSSISDEDINKAKKETKGVMTSGSLTKEQNSIAKILRFSIRDLEQSQTAVVQNRKGSFYDLVVSLNNTEVRIRYIKTILKKGGKVNEKND